MQQFKPKYPHVSNAPRSAGKQAEKSAAQAGSIREIICPDTYSPIWQKAFALADNVRFTRTPDSELRRRRAAIDPAYAKILAEQEAAVADAPEQGQETEADEEIRAAADSAPAPEASNITDAPEASDIANAPDASSITDESAAYEVTEAPAESDNPGHDRIEQMLEQAEAAFAPAPAADEAEADDVSSVTAEMSSAADMLPPHEENEAAEQAESACAPQAAEVSDEAEMPRNPVMDAQDFAAAVRQDEDKAEAKAEMAGAEAPESKAEASKAKEPKADAPRVFAFPWNDVGNEAGSAAAPRAAAALFKNSFMPKPPAARASALDAVSAASASQAETDAVTTDAAAAQLFKAAGASGQKIYWLPIPAAAVAEVTNIIAAHMPPQPVMPFAAMPLPPAASMPAVMMPSLMPAAYGFGAMAGLHYGTVNPAAPAEPEAVQPVAAAVEPAEPKTRNIRPSAPISWTKASAKPIMRVNMADYSAERAAVPPLDELEIADKLSEDALGKAAKDEPAAVITDAQSAPAASESAHEVNAADAPAPESAPAITDAPAQISVKADLAQEDLDRLCSTAVEKTERHTVMPKPHSQAEQASDAAPENIAEPVAETAEREDAPIEETALAKAADAKLSEPHPLLRPAQPLMKYSYALPSVDLLQEPVYNDGSIISQETLERSAGLLESVLEDFGVKGEIIHVRPGPVVTLYEFEPAPGVKSSRVIGLADDIARSMSAVSARVAVIPGRNVIGIELPNKQRETVYLREILQSKAYKTSECKLPLALGKLIGGEPIIAELAKMPHLLVAGTTGSGKSVAINTMILSLLYRMPPSQCRLIMVDPKMLELSIYDGIPHLLTPVVTDPKKALSALKWAVREMEERYRKMAKLGVRNIDGFNARVKDAAQKGETIMCTVQAGFDKETGELLYTDEAMDLTPLPYIVIIVDEMADLMMVAGKEIEGAIQRLAQMARAAGIHLIMATQRPSVDVITGTIKANFPTRISFQVTSKIDSRTILGEQGAETLLGQGDMLYMAGGGRLKRVHGPFVSDREVEKVVAHLKTQGTPEYLATVTESNDEDEEEETSVAEIVAAAAAGSNDDFDELYIQAVKTVMRDKKCSTSYIQRRLGIGYNKAASLVEKMEEEGLVGEANHVGKREILVNNA